MQTIHKNVQTENLKLELLEHFTIRQHAVQRIIHYYNLNRTLLWFRSFIHKHYLQLNFLSVLAIYF